LLVTGDFVTTEDKAEFERRVTDPGLAVIVQYFGFVLGEQKNQLLREADLFCFPTYYFAESFGLVLVEAMAFGLPIVATRWRSIPELLPPAYPGLVEPRHPEQVAQGLLALLPEIGSDLRDIFLRHYTLEAHLATLASAIRSVTGEDEVLPILGN
jgi:glycosyltransferase involved in cell wall biosynthesis